MICYLKYIVLFNVVVKIKHGYGLIKHKNIYMWLKYVIKHIRIVTYKQKLIHKT